MPRLRVHAFGISVDGCDAGPHQDLGNPISLAGVAPSGPSERMGC